MTVKKKLFLVILSASNAVGATDRRRDLQEIQISNRALHLFRLAGWPSSAASSPDLPPPSPCHSSRCNWPPKPSESLSGTRTEVLPRYRGSYSQQVLTAFSSPLAAGIIGNQLVPLVPKRHRSTEPSPLPHHRPRLLGQRTRSKWSRNVQRDGTALPHQKH